MPPLAKDATTAEQFILWLIDFRGWCKINGAQGAIIGPLPQNISDDDRDEGLQYLCAAVEDKNLKHAVAARGGAGGAPDALDWLQREFLQGVEFQPSLNAILDNMSLGSKESLVAFKARFMKISDEIQPALPDAILCQKINIAIKRHSGSSLDDCITTATADSNFVCSFWISTASFFISFSILPEEIISSISCNLLIEPLIVFQLVKVPPNHLLLTYGRPIAEASSLTVLLADLLVPTNKTLLPFEQISSTLEAAALRCSCVKSKLIMLICFRVSKIYCSIFGFQNLC